MPVDPWFDEDGEMDIEEVQEDLSFAAHLYGIDQRSKANKQREIANKQREKANKQREEANKQREEGNRQQEKANKQRSEVINQAEQANNLATEHLELKKAEAKKNDLERERANKERKWKSRLANCEKCGNKITRRGVELCGHCGVSLVWAKVDGKDYLPAEVPAAQERLAKRVRLEAKARIEQEQRNEKKHDANQKRKATKRQHQKDLENVWRTAENNLNEALFLARRLPPSKDTERLVAELESKAKFQEKVRSLKNPQSKTYKNPDPTSKIQGTNETKHKSKLLSQVFSCSLILFVPCYLLFLTYQFLAWINFLSLPGWYSDLHLSIRALCWLSPIAAMALETLAAKVSPKVRRRAKHKLPTDAEMQQSTSSITKAPNDANPPSDKKINAVKDRRFFDCRNKVVKGPFTPIQIVEALKAQKLKTSDEIGSSESGPFTSIEKEYQELKRLAVAQEVDDLIRDVD